MNYKKQLAKEITKQFHGNEKADQAQKEFEKVYQNKELPKKIPTFSAKNLSTNPTKIDRLLFETKLAGTISEAKRLINQKAVKINDSLVTDRTEIKAEPGTVINVGKKRWVKIKK